MGQVIMSGIVPKLTVPAPPPAGLPVSDLIEGQIVMINENGSPVPYYVAKRDYESGLNGTGRILLVKKGYYNTTVAFGSNAYAGGTLDNWFINTYKPMLDSKLQELIGETKIPVYQTSGSTTVTSISRAVFALSMVEYGGAGGYYPEGSALPIASTLKSGITVDLWSRTVDNGTSGNAIFLYYTGGSHHYTTGGTWARYYPQPAFTIPSTALVDPEPNADGSVNLLL